MHFELNERQIMLRDAVRDFARREIRPHVRKWDDSECFPRELIPKMAELGLWGMVFPEELGGAGMGASEFALAMGEIAKEDPSVALTLAAHVSLCTNHIYLFASDAAKKHFVPKLASGEMIGAWALTEPGSGSDSGALKTFAKKDGDSWVINGSKIFATNASFAGVCVVMARTDMEKKDITAFVVPMDTPGMKVGKKEQKLGMKASETIQLFLEDCRVPDANRCGEVGDGFRQAMNILDGGRIGIGALSLGIAEGALETAARYARERKAFGGAIAQFQAIQWKLADMAMNIEAARLLIMKAAALRDAGESVTLAAAQAKLFASEMAVKAAEEAVQILGGYGYVREYGVEKLWRDSKLCTIGEGSSEIQRLVIAREILKG